MVSDHVCFVRAGGLDSGHLMPVPRTKDALDVLVANVKLAQRNLPVPLALENVAALLEWPDGELSEGQFLAELVERTDCWLLVDVANLYANARNIGTDPERFLDEIPLERLAYVHVAAWRTARRHLPRHARPRGSARSPRGAGRTVLARRAARCSAGTRRQLSVRHRNRE